MEWQSKLMRATFAGGFRVIYAKNRFFANTVAAKFIELNYVTLFLVAQTLVSLICESLARSIGGDKFTVVPT